MATAWNAGAAAAYAALFTADATYVAFNGQTMRGRTATEDGHRWLFEGPLRFSRMIHSTGSAAAERHIRFIRPDVALGHAAGGGVQLAGNRRGHPPRGVGGVAGPRRRRRILADRGIPEHPARRAAAVSR